MHDRDCAIACTSNSQPIFVIQDCPDGDVFALGKALFVIPKSTNHLHQQNGLEKGFVEEKKETEAIVCPKETC